MQPKILVTGGAGYIGSHVVRQLVDEGFAVVVYDNLSTGFADAVLGGKLICADLADQERLHGIMESEKFSAVMHFAGSIVVPESIALPLSYYQNNSMNTLNLLRACEKFQVDHFIFSSTAAVYGISEDGFVSETSPVGPINPYGHSKLMTEQMLKDLAFAHPHFRYVALRYFNVAGADLLGRIGQRTPNATHLIKIACELACHKRHSLQIFGTDYPTPDGTCIRDYIHVEDLASAHILALRYLLQGGQSDLFNLGYGHGLSVREVLNCMEKDLDLPLKVQEAPRRPGDAPILVADSRKIRSVLGWSPRYDHLPTILQTAYQWEKKLS